LCRVTGATGHPKTSKSHTRCTEKISELTFHVARSLRIAPNVFREQSVEVLKKTNLEWTQFNNGLFLDYYGMPHIESYLDPLVVFVDIAHRTAAIPGNGDELINLTYTKDLAKFVVAALSLEKWEKVMRVYSEQTSIKQIVQLAEETTGKTCVLNNRIYD
jgi:hypothetical protein